MRHLVATFDPEDSKDKKCLIVKFPVPTIAEISDYVGKLKKCGAVCIDYVGEAWKIIPPVYKSETIYKPTFDLIKLDEAGKFSPKLAGRMDGYFPDIGGDHKPKIAVEVDPIALATIIFGTAPSKNADSGLYEITGNETGCTGNLIKQDICTIYDVIPRFITLRGNSTYEGVSEAQKKLPKIFNRKVPVQDADSVVLDCIKKISDGFKGINCFGYKGESVSRIDLAI